MFTANHFIQERVKSRFSGASFVNFEETKSRASFLQRSDVHRELAISNLRGELAPISKKLSIQKPQDWYQVSPTQFKEHGGTYLLKQHAGSLFNLLHTAYPDFEWQPWLFTQVPSHFWQDSRNHRPFLDWIALKEGYTNLQAWYSLTTDKIAELGGASLLRYCGFNVYKLLKGTYPEHDWKPWLFARVPKGFWQNIDNQRSFMDWQSTQLGLNSKADWYKISVEELLDTPARHVLKLYDNSLIKLLTKVYPEYPWKPWLFLHAPSGFWKDTTNQRMYLDWLAGHLKIASPQDWYKVTVDDIVEHNGTGVMQYCHSNVYNLLKEAYPEQDWKPWLFHKVPKGFWNSKENQRRFLEWIGDQLSVQTCSDWYKVPYKSIFRLGGKAITDKYRSLPEMFQTLYPEYDWQPWLFHRVSNEFWDDKNNQQEYVSWLEKQFGINAPEDWQNISWNDIVSLKGSALMKRHQNSPFKLLSTMYPDHHWDGVVPQRSELILMNCVQKLFPKDTIVHNHKITFNGHSMNIDIYLPDKALALEYLGEHHYKATNQVGTPNNIYKSQYIKKKKIVEQQGITLVSVPYWWDRSVHTLAASILQVRPDVLDMKVDPTSSFYVTVPKNQRESVQLMLTGHREPPSQNPLSLMLAYKYNNRVSPTGWWLSEKYDGVRAYWDGKQLVSRNYLPLQIPDHILRSFPSTPLDGEIWFGYGGLSEAMKIPHKNPGIQWDKFQFIVFDCPTHGGVFEDRLANLQSMIPSDHPYLKVVKFEQCTGRSHLQEFFDAVLKKNGEGIMLRAPHSLYCSGRTHSLLKLKPYVDDDAVVVAKTADSKLWQCILPDGTAFNCFSKQNQNIQVGSVVRFQHAGYMKNGRPKLPLIMESRDDLNVEKMLQNYYHYSAVKRDADSSCAACNKTLPAHTLHATANTLHQTDLCLTRECLQSQKENLPFKGTVVLPSNVMASKEELPKDVEIISPSTFC